MPRTVDGGSGVGGRRLRPRPRTADVGAVFGVHDDGRGQGQGKKLTQELVSEVKTRGFLVRQRAALGKKLDRMPTEEEWAEAVDWKLDAL